MTVVIPKRTFRKPSALFLSIFYDIDKSTMPRKNNCCRDYGNDNYCDYEKNQCRPPFVVPPTSQFGCGAKFRFNECKRRCESSSSSSSSCYSSDTSLDFLCEDDVYTSCPDMRRTCTRGDCCTSEKSSSPKKCNKKEKKSKKEKHDRDNKQKKDHKHQHNNNNNEGEWISNYEKKDKNHHKKERSHDSSTKIFNVTLVDKCLHPQSHRIEEGAKVWAINGSVGPRVNLRRGSTYYFRVSQESSQEQEFYFTRDIMGGPSDDYGLNIEGTSPVKNGIVCLKITDQTPRTFYYQSKSGAFRGGLIVVLDKK